MDTYEYEGHKVLSIGINDVGAYVVETIEGEFIRPNMKLTAGMMKVNVEEVASAFGVEHPGQSVFGPRRWA